MAEKESNNMPRSVISISTGTVLKILAILVGLYFLYFIWDIILLMIISVILAAAISPLVEWLYSRVKFPRGLTVGLVYIVFIGLVALMLAMLIPTLVEEFQSLGANLQDFRYQFEAQGSVVYQAFERFGLSSSLQTIGSALSSLTSGLVQKTLGVFSGLFDTITVLVVSFYLVVQQNGMRDFFKSVTPVKYHATVSTVVTKVQKKLSQWLLGQLTLMFSIFLLMYIALSVLRVKYALTLALFAGLLEVVPYLGPIISAVPGILVTLIQSQSLFWVLIVALVYWVVQQAENYLLVPKIIGKSIGVNPLVVLIALLIGFKIAGVVGILISAPIVAAGQVILEEYDGYRRSALEPPAPPIPK